MRRVVGIDAGGTKLAVGLVDTSSGEVFAAREVQTRTERGGAAVLADCVQLASELAAGEPLDAIGIGVPELVTLGGEIESACSWDWRDGRWKSAFAEIAPVHVNSDVRVAALAEARLGAGRRFTSFIYVTIGTGISQTFVLHGSPWPGARGNALILGSPPVELVASGPALAARAGKDRAEDVLRSPGDRQLVEQSAHDLAIEIARLVNALDPEGVVIGGGLGLAEEFRDLVVASLRPAIYAGSTRELEVLAASLGSRAGIIGAAISAEMALSEQGP
jgi:glucokinase